MDTPPRSKRKVSRVNYAEDILTADLPQYAVSLAEPKPVVATNGVIKSKPGRRPNALTTEPLNVPAPKPLSERDQAALVVKEKFAMNWQRKFSPTEKLSMAMDFEGALLVGGVLQFQDGTELKPEDHVYILAEPPGESYYIGRIMEFVPKQKKGESNAAKPEPEPEKYAETFSSVSTRSALKARRRGSLSNAADLYQVRVNWLYRQQDVSRNTTDSRLLFATMHSDLCPLHGLRGKCTVMLRDYIEDLDLFVQQPNSFYFSQLYDRYIARFFDVIPTTKITNIPPKLQQVLQQRFKYAVVESGRGKDLMSSPQSCNKCLQWCSSEDSVQCAHCKQHYHMLCLDPPIYRKPARGFGWSCAACSGALERKLEENKGIFRNSRLSSANTDDGEVVMEDSSADDPSVSQELDTKSGTRSASPSTGTSRYEELEAAVDKNNTKDVSSDQRHLQQMWPFRYLGMHSRLEDVLEFDDRIYPRAASRLGTKHQCPVSEWPGRPVIYVEREKAVRRKGRGATLKNRAKQAVQQQQPEGEESSSESGENTSSVASMSRKDRPAWVQDKPAGYIERGGDSTSTLHWKNPPDHLERVDEFLEKTKSYAEKIGMKAWSPNFIDSALEAYMDCAYEEAPALKIVSTFSRKSLKEPTFTEDEKKRFADAVRKYGSELHPVYKEVGTKTSADVVRYYYLWKKTAEGHSIWDNFEGRKKKRKADVKQVQNALADEVADDGDDSAYDNEKAKSAKRSFVCKFCQTTSVREWRRAPGYPVAGQENPVVALCLRCARLWRKYAVVWEEPDEVMKKFNQRAGNGWKRKVEFELLEDSKAIYAERDKEMERERSRKKVKVDKQQKEKAAAVAVAAVVNAKDIKDSKVKTKEAKLDSKSNGSSSASTPKSKVKGKTDKRLKIEEGDMNGEGSESPVLTGTTATPTKTTSISLPEAVDMVVPPPTIPCSVCKQLGPFNRQLDCQSCGLNVHPQCYGISEDRVPLGSSWLCDTCSNDLRPLVSTLYACTLCPVREHQHDTVTSGSVLTDGLKRTQDYNWAHVRCAVWNPEIQFGDTKTLQPVLNITKIPKSKLNTLCKICTSTFGSCVSCKFCGDMFHVGCAAKRGFAIGFDIQPVPEGSGIPTVTLGQETGRLRAVVACSSHVEFINNLYRMAYVDPVTKKSVLQLYVEIYKKADTFGGAQKRAQLFDPPVVQESLDAEGSSEGAKLSLPELDLVVSESADKDFGNIPFGRGTVACSTCQTRSSAFWFKMDEGSMKCADCFWQHKDQDMYDRVFRRRERISILDDPFLQGPKPTVPVPSGGLVPFTSMLHPVEPSPAPAPETRRKLPLHDILI